MCSNWHKNRNEHTGCLSHQRLSDICNRQLLPITVITGGLIGLHTPQEVGGDMWGAVKTPCPSSLACLGPQWQSAQKASRVYLLTQFN